MSSSRTLYRSRLLLDEDRAVRSSSLATLYQSAGMNEVALSEAARAVSHDYANYSAHLFLSESYNALRDPTRFNLRYETPWFIELLLANLLTPPGVPTISANISQQEYSRLFDADHLGLFSSTEYYSSGDWVQRGSQYGTIDHTGYSVDAFYRTENGQRPNNDLEQLELAARIKQELTPQDTICKRS